MGFFSNELFEDLQGMGVFSIHFWVSLID